MSRHFCCCIPVRVAVFITSLLALFFSAIIAGLSFFVLIKYGDNNDPNLGTLEGEPKAALGIAGGFYTLAALISLFGFIGSVIRKRSFVAVYGTMLFFLLLLQTAIDVYFIYSLFHDIAILKCKTTNSNGQTTDCDKNVLNDVRGVAIGIVVIQWLIQLYVCIIVKRYIKQLDEEQSYSRTVGQVNSAFKMGDTAYYPHQPLDQNEGLLAPKGQYPYTDPHHGFGSSGGNV